jgi:hypothetical protein
MAVSFRVLITSKYCEAVQVTQYTATNAQAIIDKFTATNITANYVTISVNLVIGGGSAQSSNLIVDAQRIAPHQTYFMPEIVGHILERDMFISTLASTASAIVIRASGREIT